MLTSHSFYSIVDQFLKAFGAESHSRNDTIEELDRYCTLFIENLWVETFMLGEKDGETGLKLKSMLKVVEPNDRLFLRVPYLIKQWQRSIQMKKTFGNNS